VKPHAFRAGDVVFHLPSGEKWLLAYGDSDSVSACGWPESIAKAADCRLIVAASDADHREMLERWAAKGTGDHRAGVCRRQLEEIRLSLAGDARFLGAGI
jgi:hypothetical protein